MDLTSERKIKACGLLCCIAFVVVVWLCACVCVCVACVLCRWGLIVRSTTSPEEALTWVEAGARFDACLIDAAMPGKLYDGKTLAIAIRTAINKAYRQLHTPQQQHNRKQNTSVNSHLEASSTSSSPAVFM
jgi:CheY-like chemotaxis protein